MEGVARSLQLLAEVALGRRLLLAEQVAQDEEAVDAAQQHLQLEEHLLAPGDVQGPDPALALGQVDRADALRIAHQLEEEILREGPSVHGSGIVPQLTGPREFALGWSRCA